MLNKLIKRVIFKSYFKTLNKEQRGQFHLCTTLINKKLGSDNVVANLLRSYNKELIKYERKYCK